MTWTALNPLRLAHPELPPALVIAARIVTLALILRGDSPFRVHLPVVGLLDAVDPAGLDLATRGAAGIGYVLVLFSPLVRLGAGLSGSAYLLGLLACRPCHSVAHTFVACLLLVVALSSGATGTRVLRAQVVLLYAGAAFNKTFDVDWWNGRYFETLLIARHDHTLYAAATTWLPEGWLSIAMGLLTIVTQWLLAACFLRPRWTGAGVVLAIAFHGGMVLLLNATFGPFVIALIAAYVGLTWPDAPPARPASGSGWAAAAAWMATRPAMVLLATMLITSEAFGGLVRNVSLVTLSLALLPLALRDSRRIT
ncbi:MAG TPA: hypothetical protein VMM93_10215 [Vicinamibacterales bacterium]|nr:hypothetical protein [Vicinamibacterales bacterium]